MTILGSKIRNAAPPPLLPSWPQIKYEPWSLRYAEGQVDDVRARIELGQISKRHGVRELTLRSAFDKDIKKYKARRGDTSQFQGPEPEDDGRLSDPAKLKQEYDAAWVNCQHLAESPELTKELLDVARRLGVAGDNRGVVSAFLVAVSRLLKKPNRMLRKGAPASGKNHVVDAVVQNLLCPDDYIVLTAASAKALIYSARDFRHRLLIIPKLPLWSQEKTAATSSQ